MKTKSPLRIGVIAYLLLVHLLLGLLLMGRVSWVSPVLRDRDHALKHAFFQRQMSGFHRRVDEMGRTGSVLFVGDSQIQGMNVDLICDNALNFGIGGDTTAGVIDRLPEIRSLNEAEALVLSIGYNDLKTTSDAQILANFGRILEMVPKKVPVLVCSLIEVDEEVIGSGINERVNHLNTGIESLCKGRDLATFINLNSALLEAFSGQHGEFLESDGCHLNLKGRRFWADSVRGVLED